MANLFSLFGLSEGFDIDLGLLEKKYFELQKSFHPDKFVGKSDKERISAIHKSGEINDGYKTLGNTLLRAEYILSLKGVEAAASPALLMEAMEQRENLANAQSAEEVSRIAKQNEENKRECIEGLSEAFAENDINKAAELAIKLKYLEKFSDEIRIKKTRGLAHAS